MGPIIAFTLAGLIVGWTLRGIVARFTPAVLLTAVKARWRAWHTARSRPRRGGRPRIGPELIELIRRMSRDNPLWGAPRIHGELLKLGFRIAQSTVSKYMPPPNERRSGQSWATFLRAHAADIAAIDMFCVPTLDLRLLYGVVVLGLGRRRILHVEACAHPTALWLARQITEAFPWEEAPATLLRDNDRAFGLVFRRRLSAMGIRDKPIHKFRGHYI